MREGYMLRTVVFVFAVTAYFSAVTLGFAIVSHASALCLQSAQREVRERNAEVNASWE